MDFSKLAPARTVRLATAYAGITAVCGAAFAALGHPVVAAGAGGAAVTFGLLAWRYPRLRRQRRQRLLYLVATTINVFALVSITARGTHAAPWLMPLILFNILVCGWRVGAGLSVFSLALAVALGGYLDDPPMLISTLGAALATGTGLAIFARGMGARMSSLSSRVRHDALTGLLNRRAFDDDLAASARDSEPFALVLLDLDRFKPLNDHHGHQAGDTVLRQFGRLLRRHLRGRDRAYRYGGEEFAVLAPSCGPHEALQVAERIRQALEAASLGPQGDVTVSAGTAAWRPGEGTTALVERADAALYAAKTAGRNRCRSAEL